MVTLGKKYGRLANRLWIFSYFAANAIENGYQLVYRNFDEYIKYFESTSKNDFRGYPIKARLSKNLVLDHILYYKSLIWVRFISKFREKGKSYEILRIKDSGEGYDLNSSEFIKKAKSTHIVIRQGGYWYKDNVNLEKHGALIRKFFEPMEKYLDNIEKLINKAKASGNCLVGVHLRKTDFSRAYNGKYFYDDTFYKQKMLEVEKVLKNNGRRPVYILCSDEKIDSNNFIDINFISGNNHMIEDLYTFSRCDYLIGPPSTYTSWASFYGNVPVKFLTDENRITSMDDFKSVENISQMYNLLQVH